MGFWTDTVSPSPKRNYRWIMLMAGIPQWIVKKVNKPGFTIGEASHQYLNHTFYYPGRVEYEKTSITLVDPVTPDASALMMKILHNAGYRIPMKPNHTQTLSKESACRALGNVQVASLGPEGNPIERWTYMNAWLTSAKFGDLDYSNDDLTEIQIELRYDFVTLPQHGETDFAQYLNVADATGEGGDVLGDF